MKDVCLIYFFKEFMLKKYMEGSPAAELYISIFPAHIKEKNRREGFENS